MKYITCLWLILLSSFIHAQKERTPFLSNITKQFPNVRDIAISPNCEEIMFSAQSTMGNLSAIISIKKTESTWSNPKIVSFSGKYFDLEPFYSNNGLKLYFASKRPLKNIANEDLNFDIWYVERQNLSSNWSEPKNMGEPINTNFDEFYPSIAKNGNFYFTRDNTTLKRKDDIYKSEFINDKLTEPKRLPNTINTDGYEYNAFIASDESYLIYGCYGRKDGFGSGDLYISFNTENGWSEAKNLGDTINSTKMDYCPFIDAKTNTLYFTSKLDNTKTKFEKPISFETLLNEFNKHGNGTSRLYKISTKNLLIFNKEEK